MANLVATALTIAGTDPTGGAGVQADLKTFQERGVFGMSVITSVVAQNTLGVQEIENLSVPFIEAQLESVFSDIIPDVVKTGMIATVEMMEVIAQVVEKYELPYIIDPVMIAKSGDYLMNESSQSMIRERLLPLATIVTPNLPEAEVLLDMEIKSLADQEKAAEAIVKELKSESAIVKGGHATGEPIDVLFDGKELHHFSAERIETKHTHGTGCTFSAVIAAEIAKGTPLVEAITIAKAYITDAIQFSLKLGKGNGPTNHWGHRLQGLPSRRSK